MGQQMGKEVEPPLICSTEIPETGHTQRRKEKGGKRKVKHRCWDVKWNRQRYNNADNERGWLQTTVDILTLSSHQSVINLYTQQSGQQGEEV